MEVEYEVGASVSSLSTSLSFLTLYRRMHFEGKSFYERQEDGLGASYV